MQALFDVLGGFVEIIFKFFGFILNFLEDVFQMIAMVGSLPTILYSVLQWTSSIGILPYIVTIVGIAIVYKILGRE